MTDQIERARELARKKHDGMHVFDAARTPIFEHIREVAALVREQGGSEAMIAAAWLHDIVEDTDVTLAQVGEWFGPEVRALVDGLTDPADFEAMPLAERKQRQAERIGLLSDDVKRVKLCDQLSNVERVLNNAPTDWSEEEQRTYIEGARRIVLRCRGLWPALDERFERAYAPARTR